MQDYENNTEHSMTRADKAEWNHLKDDKTHRMSKAEYKKINKKREEER